MKKGIKIGLATMSLLVLAGSATAIGLVVTHKSNKEKDQMNISEIILETNLGQIENNNEMTIIKDVKICNSLPGNLTLLVTNVTDNKATIGSPKYKGTIDVQFTTNNIKQLLSEVVTKLDLSTIADNKTTTIIDKIFKINTIPEGVSLDAKDIQKTQAIITSPQYEDNVIVKFVLQPTPELADITTIIKTTFLNEIIDKTKASIVAGIKRVNEIPSGVEFNLEGIMDDHAMVSSPKYKNDIKVEYNLKDIDPTKSKLETKLTTTLLPNQGEESGLTQEKLIDAIKQANNFNEELKIESNDSLAIVVSSPNYNGTVTLDYEVQRATGKPNAGQNKSARINEWSDANFARTKSVIDKTEVKSNTYFSPYLDGGMSVGNNIDDILDTSTDKLENLTLAFLLVNDKSHNEGNEDFDLSIATDGNDESNKTFANKVLKPFLEHGTSLSNITLAFGGANAAPKNVPWNYANELAHGDFEKGYALFKDSITRYTNKLGQLAGLKNGNDFYRFDFDIEGSLQQDEGNHILVKYLTKWKSERPGLEFSYTLPVLPTGLVGAGLGLAQEAIEATAQAGQSWDRIPVINVMAMDYGEGSWSNTSTDFDYAKEAAIATEAQIKAQVFESFKDETKDVYDNEMYQYVGVTPMIGVNDVQADVYTLEDAKDLYNWANENNLHSLGMWSMNDDNVPDPEGTSGKDITNHGLAYLNQYDFAKAFTGVWDREVLTPKTSPDYVPDPNPVIKQDISVLIKTAHFTAIDGVSNQSILKIINDANKTSFTKLDLDVSEVKETDGWWSGGGQIKGRGNFKGKVQISIDIVRYDLNKMVDEENPILILTGSATDPKDLTHLKTLLNKKWKEIKANYGEDLVEDGDDWLPKWKEMFDIIQINDSTWKFTSKVPSGTKTNPFFGEVTVEIN